MVAPKDDSFSEALRAAVRLWDASPRALDPVMDLVRDQTRFVLIGEASHGTHEFYKARADLTKRLVKERGFNAVVVEADWPDAYRVNRYVHGRGKDGTADEALGGFERFPQWMWRNADVLDFVGWLRAHNDALRATGTGCGFYGMDLYSMYGSMAAVLKYLDEVDPEAGKRARSRYACFDHAGENPQAYGYAASFGMAQPCSDAVVQQLVELRGKAAEYTQQDGETAEDEYFFAEQNARLVKNAERYYRSMFEGHNTSWNLRDRHMVESIEHLMRHLDRDGGVSRFVVWAHNSHLGDARATEMGDGGELNVGQLVRENWADAALNVGFSTYEGTVAAADNWDEPAQIKRVRPGLPRSYEALFHDLGVGDFVLPLRGLPGRLADDLRTPRLQRAIGVIYRPETERVSHYFHARLADQFDAMIHIDQTRAVEPLERVAKVESREMPETYPSAL